MADTYVVTKPTNWTRLTTAKSVLFDVDTAVSDPDEYVQTKTLWATDMSPSDGGASRVVISGSTEVPDNGSVAWKFYSDGATASTADVRIWGISKIFDPTVDPGLTEYLADYLCKLEIEAGAVGVETNSSDILPVCKFADTINVVQDRSIIPGGRVISYDDNAAASVVFDGLGYWGYIVEMAMTNGTNVGWGALYRVF